MSITKGSSCLMGLMMFILIEASCQFSFGQEIIPSHLNETAQVSGTNMTIKYDLTGGSLVSINAEAASDSLVVSLHVGSGGTFIINLPRALIDARQNGDDTHFLVQVNEHGVNYEEITSPSNRLLKISFNQGAEKIRIVGTQMLVPPSTITESPSVKPEILEAPFTDTPPAINGEWNTPLEWDKSKAVNSEINGTDMYVLAKHDSKFLYILVDIPTDNTTSSSASFLRYELLMIFNRGMYEGDNLDSNETAVGTSHVFLNGTKINTNLVSEMWTYDNDGKPVDLQTPSDYNSTMGFSSTNDPFNSAQ
ncbi:MAG: hypothetical protein KGH83_02465, partial [Thaumarchaeota archaeon]|nr:hypothetical protein [Nitrososphaerota archaeon]